MPDLQVALDIVDLDIALDIASKSLQGGATILEVGTPLIKAHGMEAVSKICRLAGEEIRVVADMKTSDAGYLETELAAKAGADVTTVLACSSPSTVEETVRAGNDLGIAVLADLMEVGSVSDAAREMEDFGVGFICVHSGIDTGQGLEQSFDKLGSVAEAVNIEVAAAGGLDHRTASQAIERGASIVIVGRAITRSSNPELSTKRIREAIGG